MSFQNIGTFDAGVIKSGAAPMSGVPTMDAAGIASGGAFLISELEKRDPMIRKPLTSFTYPRDIVIQTGGGWVDYVSAMSVGYGTTGGSGSSLVQAGGSNGLPIVQANVEKGVYKAHTVAMALRVMFQDMQRANFIGRSIDQLLQDGIRLTYDKHMDQNVYVGFTEYNTTGLVNNPDATASTVADGASGNGNWATKTPNEILNDVNTALTETWAQAGYDLDAIPNHILIPYEEYTYIMNTPFTLVAEGAQVAFSSIYEYIKKHRPALYSELFLTVKLKAHCLEIGDAAQARLDEMLPALMENAGATEELKRADPMKWVGLVNACKAQAEEVIKAELIYN